MMRNSLEYFTVLFGAARAGLVTVPIDRRSSAHDLHAIVEEAGLSVLVVDTWCARVLENAAPVPASCRLLVVGMSSAAATPGDRSEASTPGSSPVSFEELLSGAKGGASSDDFADVDATETQCILFTSGTTGTPRGVMRTYGANLASAQAALGAIPTQAGGAWVYTLPMHSVGVYPFGLAPLLVGGYVIAPPEVDGDELLEFVDGEQDVMLHGVPTVWEKLMLAGSGERLTSLRTALWGGSPLSSGTAERLEESLPLRCLGCYGSSEAPCIT